MSILGWISFVILFFLTAASAYLWILAFWAMVIKRDYPRRKDPFDFLILVPAHDEEKGLPETIKSLGELRPTGKLEIVVIADNCSDKTAEVAENLGAVVLERHNISQRGKGYALEYALTQIDLTAFHAVAVIDADTRVDPNLLEAMAVSFLDGAGAVQVSNEFAVSGDSPLAYLQQTANMAENAFYYQGRAALGLPVLLRGTGMAISTRVLKAYPWTCHTVTEDIDYAVNLIRNNVHIDFTRAGRIVSAATTNYAQAYSQKQRWAAGAFNLIIDKAILLFWEGLSHGNLKLTELAWSFLTLSRPTLIFIGFIPLILAALLPGGQGIVYALWSLSIMASLVLYLLGGIFFVENKSRAFRAVLHAPFFGLWLVWLQIKTLFSRRKLDWVRTERNDHD